jgi:hypothetical protein
MADGDYSWCSGIRENSDLSAATEFARFSYGYGPIIPHRAVKSYPCHP